MRHDKRLLAKWRCIFSLGLAMLAAHGNYCASAESNNSRNDPSEGMPTIGTWNVAIGEIQGVPTVDGSKVKCSEVLNLPKRVIVKTFDVDRHAYMLDIANKTFTYAEGSIDLPRGMSEWTEGAGRYFGGEKESVESVLCEWECRFPATNNLVIVVSSGILNLSDGRQIVCRFHPLLLTNHSILTRIQKVDEDDKGNKGAETSHHTNDQQLVAKSVRFHSGLGDIRGVLSADGSKVECSEILGIPQQWVLKSCETCRNVYVVDVAHKTFSGGASLTNTWRSSSDWSEHRQSFSFFTGKKDLVLRKWEQRLPLPKDLNIIVSSVILGLSDGQGVLCHIEPLFLANGSVLAWDEETTGTGTK
jgi:hypothetical protein